MKFHTHLPALAGCHKMVDFSNYSSIHLMYQSIPSVTIPTPRAFDQNLCLGVEICLGQSIRPKHRNLTIGT